MAKKTPLEQKIDAIADSFQAIIEIFLQMAESFDNKVIDIENKLSNLISKVDTIQINSSSQNLVHIPEKKEKNPLPPPTNPPKISVQQSGNVRRDLIEELTSYFEKRNLSKKKEKKY
ncbi:MAG: hypothetical protein ACTSR8_01065 [Promethearchaeota archaeon]